MKYHLFTLITWFLGLIVFAKSIKLIALSYPSEKLKKFKRFASWFIFVAATAGLLCVTVNSFGPWKKDHKGCCDYPNCMMMEQGGMGMQQGEMTCPAEEKK